MTPLLKMIIMRSWIILYILEITYFSYTNSSVSLLHPQPYDNVSVTCNAYCNIHGSLYPMEECQGGKFCCGNRYEKFCCLDFKQALYPDPEYPSGGCNESTSWWYYQWRLITGMLALLVTGLLIMVIFFCIRHYGCCCCEDCTKTNDRHDPHPRDNNPNNVTLSDIRNYELQEREFHNIGIVSPVFEPPSYEEASVQPPKYAELYGGTCQQDVSEEIGENPLYSVILDDEPPQLTSDAIAQEAYNRVTDNGRTNMAAIETSEVTITGCSAIDFQQQSCASRKNVQPATPPVIGSFSAVNSEQNLGLTSSSEVLISSNDNCNHNSYNRMTDDSFGIVNEGYAPDSSLA